MPKPKPKHSKQSSHGRVVCHPEGINQRTGRLKPRFRWAKGRKACPIPAKQA